MVSILLYLLILILVFGAIFYAVRMLAIDEPFKTVALLIVLIVFIILLLGVIGIIPGMPVRPLA